MNFEALVREAIELGLRGRGLVEPNPRVGALALQNGVVVGRGFHAEWGGRHAEVVALEDALGKGADPDTVVVTLEPCSSRGGEKKQPPCTDALVESGVETLVVGATDPDPRHAGRGIDVLRGAGIRVIEGVCARECREINFAFERWLQLDRPWVIAKWAMSLDGKIATATGDSKWISGDRSRRWVHGLRARVDAVVVGFRTAQRDDPKLTVREPEGPQPIRIVVDPDCAAEPTWHVVATARAAPTWLLVGPTAAERRRRALESLGVDVVVVPEVGRRRLDLRAGLRLLRERGLRRLLVEGGGGLFAELFAVDCIDQVEAFVAPRLVGGQTAPTPFDGAGFERVAAGPRLGEWWWAPSGEDLRIAGVFH